MTQRSRIYIVRSRGGKPLNIEALKSPTKKEMKPATAEKPAQDKKKADPKGKGDSKETKPNNDKPPEGTEGHASKEHNIPATTPEQDAKLLAMKADNKTWAEITDALGHSKGVWTSRFKQLQVTKEEKNESGKGRNDKSPKDNDTNEGGAKGKKAQQEKPHKTLKDLLDGHAAASGPALYRGEGEPKMSLSELVAFLEEDSGHFSSWDLRDLQRMVQEDEAEKWLRLASKFYDKTGRRVHEYDIRDKLDRLTRQFGGGR